MVTSGGLSLAPLKLIILVILETFWVYQALGDMLNIIVSNSDFGKRPGARDITIVGSHVGPHIPNIRYLEVYDGLWRYMKVYAGI